MTGMMRFPGSVTCLCSAVLWTVTGAAAAVTLDLPADGTDIVGEVQTLIAQHEDTLLDIARQYGLGYGEITAANPGIDPWVPGEGTRVVLPTQFVLPPGARRGIVLNVAQLRLFYFPPAVRGKPAVVITHPIGIGTDYARTPLGETRVVRKAVDPVWRPSQDIREEHVAQGDWLPATVLPGPDNPLGKFALYLGLKGGYLIHGTNKPWGVGMRVSHGCIRLYPEDIESLYPQIPIGTEVRLIEESLLIGVRDNVPYLQSLRNASPPVEDGENLTPAVESILRRLPRDQRVDWDRALQIIREGRGIPIPIGDGSPDLEQLLEAAGDSEAGTANPSAPQPEP
jgi:L,D-transpeptidase ErfK/SrfK